MAVEQNKLNGLQAGRGVAAMLVVLHHAANHLKQDFGFLPMAGIFHFGRSGVDFFFVLSGFIIFYIHAKDLGRPLRLVHYLFKRFTRIYPIYWIAISILLAMAIILGKEYSISTFLLDATLLPMAELQTLSVAWTLRYEILFYAFFAIAIISLRLGILLLGVWISVIVLHALGLYAAKDHWLLVTMSSAWNIEFMLGMLSAYYLSKNRLPKPLFFLAASVLVFILCGVMENMYILDGTQPAARVFFGVSAMFILISLVERERSAGLKIPKTFLIIGESSYSIYLMHLLIIGITYKVIEHSGVLNLLPVWLIYIILFLSAVLGGVVFSMLTERPILRASGQIAATLSKRNRPERV